MRFLILSFFIVSCASRPRPAKIDLKWEFITNPKGEIKACVSREDVLKLNEMRILKCTED